MVGPKLTKTLKLDTKTDVKKLKYYFVRESGEIRCGPVAGELQSTMTKYAELRVLFPLFPSNSIYQNICLSVGFLMKSPNGPESDLAKLNCPIPITRQKCGAIG